MDDITSLLVAHLDEVHAPIPIYREQKKGGFQEPSFFVQRVSLGVTPRIFEQQARDYRFTIVYFPAPDRRNEDMDKMAEWFASEFTRLPFGHFKDREIVPNEEELHYSFTLSVTVARVQDDTMMNELDVQGGLKNG